MLFKLKLVTTEPNSKLLMTLHKQTKASMLDIKKNCKQQKSIYECDSADTRGLITLNNLNKEIVSLGFETLLFIDEKQVDAEMFANIERRNLEIDEEGEI